MNYVEKFVGLRAKTYIYFTDDSSEDKKGKGTKMSVIKRKIKFKDHTNCLEATQLDNQINHLEKMKLTLIVLKKDYKNS